MRRLHEHVRPEVRQAVAQLVGLLDRPSHQHADAEQRPLAEPGRLRGQGRRLADDEHRRRADCPRRQCLGDRGQRRADDLLIGPRAAADDGHRRVGRLSPGDQRLAPLAHAGHAHVENQRARKGPQRAVIQRRRGFLFPLMAGDQGHGGGGLGVSDGEFRVGGHGQSGGRPGDDLQRHAGGCARRRFLPPGGRRRMGRRP